MEPEHISRRFADWQGDVADACFGCEGVEVGEGYRVDPDWFFVPLSQTYATNEEARRTAVVVIPWSEPSMLILNGSYVKYWMAEEDRQGRREDATYLTNVAIIFLRGDGEIRERKHLLRMSRNYIEMSDPDGRTLRVRERRARRAGS